MPRDSVAGRLLRAAVLEAGLDKAHGFEELPGEGAFYGPKLEFVLRDGDETYSAVTRLSEFLRTRLAGLVGNAEAVVLALCNPQAATVTRPPGLGERPLYRADGDVTAWMQRRPGARGWSPAEVEIILAAEREHRVDQIVADYL